MCATMGSIHGCAPRRGYISERGWNSPARVYVRPWGKNRSVRRDGNQFPNVVVIRPHVCARPCGKNTSVRRDGKIGTRLEFARTYVCDLGVVGIRPHVCVRPRGVHTSVRCDGTFFRTFLEFARTCVCDLGKYTRVCAATGNNFRTWFEFARTCAHDLGAKTQACAETGIDFQTWLEFAHTCVCDLGKYTRVCTDTGIDSQQSMRLLVWLRVVHEHLFRRARRNLEKKQEKTRGAQQSSERGGNVRACVLLTLGNIHGCVPRWAFIPRSPLSYRCGWENKEKTRDFEQKM